MLAVFRSRSRSQHFGREMRAMRGTGIAAQERWRPCCAPLGAGLGTRLAGWTAQWAPQCGVDAPLNGGNERGRLARWAWDGYGHDI